VKIEDGIVAPPRFQADGEEISMKNNTKPNILTIFLQVLERTPVPIKAILAGAVVYAIGSFPSLIIISLIPFPLSIFILFLFLFLYVTYFSGRLGKRGFPSLKTRIENFRAIRLNRKVWFWGVTSAMFFVVWQQSMWVVTFRIFKYDPKVMLTFQLGDLPLGFLWFAAIASAFIAGISEEVGFRGYMQVPIEGKYKPWVANVIVSIVFLLFHLNQGWAQPSMYALLFVSSIFIGMLVIASGSLIFGIIAHFVVDIFNFSYWWSDLAGKFEYRPISETGVDTHFLVWIVIFFISSTLFLLATDRVKKERMWSAKTRSD